MTLTNPTPVTLYCSCVQLATLKDARSSFQRTTKSAVGSSKYCTDQMNTTRLFICYLHTKYHICQGKSSSAQLSFLPLSQHINCPC